MATKKTTTKTAALPKGINATDLKEPSWKTFDKTMAREGGEKYGPALKFDLWYIESFGWVIPTLLIAKRRQAAAYGERTYAVRVSDGATVRVGNGPHVKARHTVYVRKTRLKALEKFLALQGTGAERANTIRDRISSRRAQTALYRTTYGF
jgi:hypothetical protein